MSEKFSLKWNDFQSNWNKAINNLHKDTDFADVTLISDDKVKFSAHKILLSSSSNMFKFILKGTNQNNSLLFLGGVSSVNLGFILEYIYQGEVNLYEEQLESFLESAKGLEIEGLLGIHKEENVDGEKHQNDEIDQYEPFKGEPATDGNLIKMEDNVGMNPRRQISAAQADVIKFDVAFLTSEEVEEKRKELYQKIDEGWRCLVCDYISTSMKSSQIRCHVETHFDGLSYTCNICSKEFKSRNLVYHHKKKNHLTYNSGNRKLRYSALSSSLINQIYTMI